MMGKRFLSAAIFAIAIAVVACSKSGSVVESRPLTTQLDGYRTGAVEIEPRGLEGGQKGSEQFLAFLEKELKEYGVLTPLAIDQGAQLIVRVRQAGSNLGEDDVRVIVDFIDAKSRATIGQITVSANGLGDKSGASMRRVASSIVSYMRSNRHAPPSKNNAPLATVAPASTAPVPGVVVSGACKTTCNSDSGSSLPPEDRTRLAETFAPMLKDMSVCLDRVNAAAIDPVIIMRFESTGLLSALRVDTGGYDDLACLREAREKVPTFAPVAQAASVRCDRRCAK